MSAIQRLERYEHTTNVSLDLKQRLGRVLNCSGLVGRWFRDVPFAGENDQIVLSPLGSITWLSHLFFHVNPQQVNWPADFQNAGPLPLPKSGPEEEENERLLRLAPNQPGITTTPGAFADISESIEECQNLDSLDDMRTCIRTN
jgi:hypothetical protein